jgi:Fic family protein
MQFSPFFDGFAVETNPLFDLLLSHPMVTLPLSIKLLDVSKQTAAKAIEVSQAAGVLFETTGKRRDRVYAYQAYLQVLTPDTD